jgi:hypothetical protein
MMVSQHFGVSTEAASMQAETLQKMLFRIRTAIGDSKDYYQHSTDTPIHSRYMPRELCIPRNMVIG